MKLLDVGVNSSKEMKMKKKLPQLREEMKMNNKPSSIGKIAPLIPFDVLPYILARIPPATVCRFISVCKTWRELIQKSSFIYMHLMLANMGLILLLSLPDRNRFFLDLENQTLFSIGVAEYCIYGSCNGLLCVRRISEKLSYYICNPGIQQILKLPKVREGNCDEVTVSFGFIPSTDEYKVMWLGYSNVHREICEICTVGRICNPWRRIGQLPNFDGDGVLHPPICVAGCMHWIRPRKKRHGFSEVLTLDLKTESFSNMNMPGGHSDPEESVYLLEWDRQLSVVKSIGGCLIIWVLDESNEWRCMIDVSLKLLGLEDEKDYIRPIAIRNGCELIFFFEDCYIRSFNFRNQRLETVYESSDRVIGAVHNHVNSLVWFG
ncbi:F-box protein At5g49610-like [Magnolia sinica]|uniref:F-box protein At5g49610-like n=1 Tax=Magnolia sinica TaxID=86752 RepID=UPI0026598516|nr:F-box protein At5g49610-like [Magnolia sinica]